MEKIVKESITLVRDGKRVTPEIGVSFTFTKEEIEQIEKARPQAIGNVDVPKKTTPAPKQVEDKQETAAQAKARAKSESAAASAAEKQVDQPKGEATKDAEGK